MIYIYPVSGKVNCYDSNFELSSRHFFNYLNHLHDIFGWNASNYFEINISMIYFQHNILEAAIKWPFGNHGINISASASALTSASTSILQKCYFCFTTPILEK